MNNLINTSKDWKKKADLLLADKNLIETLSKFGKIHFTGAYSYDLMMHGDIDISVVRDEKYTVEEIFEIFKQLYFQGKFRSYFIGGDWDDPRKGQEFPDGYYIGLKEKVNGEKWKFDIWFVNETEYAKRNFNHNLETSPIEQKELILECKKYRNDNKISITGQEIYDMVIGEKWKNLEDFKKSLK
jgi:hypothetical protein